MIVQLASINSQKFSLPLETLEKSNEQSQKIGDLFEKVLTDYGPTWSTSLAKSASKQLNDPELRREFSNLIKKALSNEETVGFKKYFAEALSQVVDQNHQDIAKIFIHLVEELQTKEIINWCSDKLANLILNGNNIDLKNHKHTLLKILKGLETFFCDFYKALKEETGIWKNVNLLRLHPDSLEGMILERKIFLSMNAKLGERKSKKLFQQTYDEREIKKNYVHQIQFFLLQQLPNQEILCFSLALLLQATIEKLIKPKNILRITDRVLKGIVLSESDKKIGQKNLPVAHDTKFSKDLGDAYNNVLDPIFRLVSPGIFSNTIKAFFMFIFKKELGIKTEESINEMSGFETILKAFFIMEQILYTKKNKPALLKDNLDCKRKRVWAAIQKNSLFEKIKNSYPNNFYILHFLQNSNYIKKTCKNISNVYFLLHRTMLLRMLIWHISQQLTRHKKPL